MSYIQEQQQLIELHSGAAATRELHFGVTATHELNLVVTATHELKIVHEICFTYRRIPLTYILQK